MKNHIFANASSIDMVMSHHLQEIVSSGEFSSVLVHSSSRRIQNMRFIVEVILNSRLILIFLLLNQPENKYTHRYTY